MRFLTKRLGVAGPSRPWNAGILPPCRAAAIGAIQSTLFFRSGLAEERLTEVLDVMAHDCLALPRRPLVNSPSLIDQRFTALDRVRVRSHDKISWSAPTTRAIKPGRPAGSRQETGEWAGNGWNGTASSVRRTRQR